jgi:hypothetical protein
VNLRDAAAVGVLMLLPVVAGCGWVCYKVITYCSARVSELQVGCVGGVPLDRVPRHTHHSESATATALQQPSARASHCSHLPIAVAVLQ